MANDVAYRTDPGATKQATAVINPTVGTEAGRRIQKVAHDSDRADFGGGAAGTVFAGEATDGATDVLGTFIPCEGRSAVTFKLEYEDTGSADPRRFRAVAQDFNATPGYVILPEVYVPTNTGLPSGVVPTLGAAYLHGEAIVVPCLGWKAMTLLLLADALTAPAVRVWGAAQ